MGRIRRPIKVIYIKSKPRLNRSEKNILTEARVTFFYPSPCLLCIHFQTHQIINIQNFTQEKLHYRLSHNSIIEIESFTKYSHNTERNEISFFLTMEKFKLKVIFVVSCIQHKTSKSITYQFLNYKENTTITSGDTILTTLKINIRNNQYHSF